MHSDWQALDVRAFDDIVLNHAPTQVASLGVIDRLPFVFQDKKAYVAWRDDLALGLEVDGRDIALIGSAATGRSLSAQKRFKTFHRKSDLDISVVSSHHFDIAWKWFRLTNPTFLTGLDQAGKEKFEQHRKHYVYEGIIAADYFLSYLPFGGDWLKALQRSQSLLPPDLQGRLQRVRIYRDFAALREHQVEAIKSYKRYLTAKRAAQETS